MLSVQIAMAEGHASRDEVKMQEGMAVTLMLCSVMAQSMWVGGWMDG